MSQLPLKTPAPPQGIIAALVTGFETVNARLELILLPLLLDLFLWLGPHLSIQRLVPPLEAALRAMAAPAGADPAMRRNLETLVAALSDYGASFNVFSVLSTAPLGLPSLVAGRTPMTVPGGAPLIWYLDNLGQYLLLAGAFVLLGLLLGAVYLGGIAQQVRDRRVNWAQLLRQVWGDWARLTALGAVALLATAALGLPVLVLTGVVTLLSPLVGGLVWLAGLTVMLWALFYGGFAVHGMLLQRRGLLSALWDSARLVQINLPYAAGLFVLVVLINVGLALVWNIPSDNSWLLLLGVAGHALISTALISATFVFYQDRYRWWIEMRQTLRARAEAEQRGRHGRKA
ncbi:MAG: hypothetical protein IT318_03190 [Anaerolineales bacterium]|nr:hypothetical protein [Anaerolineales bacterium]